MTKLEIIERQERVIRELAELNEKLCMALLCVNADIDDDLVTRSETVRKDVCGDTPMHNL